MEEMSISILILTVAPAATILTIVIAALVALYKSNKLAATVYKENCKLRYKLKEMRRKNRGRK